MKIRFLIFVEDQIQLTVSMEKISICMPDDCVRYLAKSQSLFITS